jgi:hypothetical protein
MACARWHCLGALPLRALLGDNETTTINVHIRRLALQGYAKLVVCHKMSTVVVRTLSEHDCQLLQ